VSESRINQLMRWASQGTIGSEAAQEIIDTIEQLTKERDLLAQDVAFLQSCVNSGEQAKPGDRPSQQAKHKGEL
jgi:hypothetical protein